MRNFVCSAPGCRLRAPEHRLIARWHLLLLGLMAGALAALANGRLAAAWALCALLMIVRSVAQEPRYPRCHARAHLALTSAPR